MTIYHQNIPREFNLSKYKGTDAFHAREWFYALSGRQMLFRYIQSPYLIDSDGNLTEEDQQAVLKESILKILKDPLNLNFNFDFLQTNRPSLKIIFKQSESDLGNLFNTQICCEKIEESLRGIFEDSVAFTFESSKENKKIIVNVVNFDLSEGSISANEHDRLKRLESQLNEKFSKFEMELEYSSAQSELLKIYIFGDDGAENFDSIKNYKYPPSRFIKVCDLLKFNKEFQYIDHSLENLENLNISDLLHDSTGYIHRYAEVPMIVNPYFFDKEILESIKSQLVNFRKQNEIVPANVLSGKQLKKWSNYRVLAYMDLYLWSLIFLNKGGKFSASVYQTHIHPDTDLNLSTIEKAVRGLADEIFKQNLLETFNYGSDYKSDHKRAYQKKHKENEEKSEMFLSHLDQLQYLAFREKNANS